MSLLCRIFGHRYTLDWPRAPRRVLPDGREVVFKRDVPEARVICGRCGHG